MIKETMIHFLRMGFVLRWFAGLTGAFILAYFFKSPAAAYLLGCFWLLLGISALFTVTFGTFVLTCFEAAQYAGSYWSPGYWHVFPELRNTVIISIFILGGAFSFSIVKYIAIRLFRRRKDKISHDFFVYNGKFCALLLFFYFSSFALVTLLSVEVYNPKPLLEYYRLSELSIQELFTEIEDVNNPQEKRMNALIVLGSCGFAEEQISERKILLEQIYATIEDENLKITAKSMLRSLSGPNQKITWKDYCNIGFYSLSDNRIAVFYAYNEKVRQISQ